VLVVVSSQTIKQITVKKLRASSSRTSTTYNIKHIKTVLKANAYKQRIVSPQIFGAQPNLSFGMSPFHTEGLWEIQGGPLPVI